MPRYYFIIRATDGYEDPSGTDLPSLEAAKTYGDRIIQELSKNGVTTTYTVLDVQDVAHKTILSIPFAQ